MRKKRWVFDPDRGGVRIPPAVRERTAARINRYAQAKYAGTYVRLDIRFHGVFCYIDAYTEPETPSRSLLKLTGETRKQFLARLRAMPTHLCRLRYFGDENRWGVSFYTYSNERYELCVFPSGSFFGSLEAAFDIGATYLRA